MNDLMQVPAEQLVQLITEQFCAGPVDKGAAALTIDSTEPSDRRIQ